MSGATEAQPIVAQPTETQPTVVAIGAASPVFEMLGGDTPDGAVCGIDGVCEIPEDSSTTDRAV